MIDNVFYKDEGVYFVIGINNETIKDTGGIFAFDLVESLGDIIKKDFIKMMPDVRQKVIENENNLKNEI